MNIENKSLTGHIVECKQEERNGVPVGLISGYLSTWDLDRGAWGVKDQFVRGAFLDSIADHKAKGNRPVRFKDHHGRTIGGFPIDTVKEDERGLFGIAEVNLDVQQGREAFALAKQGVLSDFSVGFSSIDDSEVTVNEQRIRKITKAILWESSLVDEPMNPEANVTDVKSVVPFQDLQLADRNTPWDGKKAAANIASANSNATEQKKAFLWSDEKKTQLQIADVIDGKLVAVPKAIFMAASAIENGSTSIPESDQGEVKKNIDGYYEKMGLESPFGEKKSFSVELTTRNIEKALRCYGFSKSESKTIATQVKVDKAEEETENANSNLLVNGLKSLISTFESSA